MYTRNYRLIIHNIEKADIIERISKEDTLR